MAAPTLAIVLNWNGASDTLQCLAALQRIESPALDVLVVDNGSSDDSVERLRACCPDLVLLQSGANLGFGGGCNVGLLHALAHGYAQVWLVNNDAQVQPDCLQHLLAALQNQPQVGAVGGVVLDAQPPHRLQLWGGGQIRFALGGAQPCKRPAVPDSLSGACLLVRCQALRAVGLFDPQRYFMYWEDADLCLRLRAAGWQLAVAPQAHMTHKLSASLGQGSATLDRYFVTSGVRFFRRHAPWPRWSVGMMVLRMVLLRAVRGQWARARAVYNGWTAA